MFALYDTFNNRVISKHRTVVAVVRAMVKLDRSLTGGAYLPTIMTGIEKGKPIDVDDDTYEHFLALNDEFKHSPISQIK